MPERIPSMNPDLLLFAAGADYIWHLLPLAAMISLVYSASRVELPQAILRRSVRLFLTILLFMGIVFLILWLLQLGL
jgi:hypothetical protein